MVPHLLFSPRQDGAATIAAAPAAAAAGSLADWVAQILSAVPADEAALQSKPRPVDKSPIKSGVTL